MSYSDAYIVAATRTPVGKAYKGAFRRTRPDDLLIHALKALMKSVPQADALQIADVIIGCAMPEAEQGMNVARIASLLAGLPESVPAVTVNRFCASGVEAVAMAAAKIQLGQADCVIAGGVESMSMVPMGGHHLSNNPRIFLNDKDVAIAYGMGLTAERVAEKWNISRERQDAFALQSHERALHAIASGAFADEISPIWVDSRTANLANDCIDMTNQQVSVDEGPRKDTSLDRLAKLKPIFMRDGTVTAGNSSQMSDGAGAVMLVSESFMTKHHLKPLAVMRGYAVKGVSPEFMGIGPVEAIPVALKQAGLNLNDIQWIELNEAFAAQSLAVMDELKLDPALVNPLGGAIALGHPLGATGAIRVATLVHGMRRQKLKYGMVTMCIGTGMGAAAVIEAL
ncbi:MAG: acetyl-CoA C-acyltransferase [Gammaproteobacteria bacterium]